MKTKFIKITLFFIILSLSGCLRTYEPIIYESSASPMIFETDNNDTLNSKYGGIDVTFSRGLYDNESLQLLKGNYIISKTKDYINTNIRLFGYSGFYKVSGLGKYDGVKSSFGFGSDLGLNINFKINKLRLGIGGNLGFSTEFGDYYSFRKSADNEGVINSKIGFVFLTFSLFPIIAYQFSDDAILSTQVNIGIPGIISPIAVFNNNDIVYWLSWIPDDKKGNDYMGRRIVFGFMMSLTKINSAF